MKIKVVLISTVVTAGLVGGIGYGAYHVLKGKAEPVDVVPVSNVNNAYYGYYGYNDTLYGVVTSQVAQTIQLNEEYEISDIYVEAGDTVKEGTPLFAYDMTLPELELEMEQLNLQTLELEKTSLEKDIDKLKKTPATASLESNGGTMTASGEEDLVILDEAAPGESGTSGGNSGGQNGGSASSPAGGNTLGILGIEEVGDPQLEEADGPSDADAEQNGQAAGNSLPDDVQNAGETEEDSQSAGETEDIGAQADGGSTEDMTLAERITAFTDAMNKLGAVYDSNEEDITSAENAENLKLALECRGLLADLQADGSWTLKDEVKELLEEEQADGLLGEIDRLSQYHAVYVGRLISALDSNAEDFPEKTAAARAAYNELNDKEKALVQNVSVLTDAEQYLKDLEMKEALTSTIREFDSLIQNLKLFYEKYKDDNLTAQNIGGAVETAAGFYREKLADRMSDGSYVIKESVQSLLGEEAVASVEKMAEDLEQYEVLYVELLIQELNETSGDLKNQAEKARTEYEYLSKAAKEKVSAESIEKLERIEAGLRETEESETPAEPETAETETTAEPMETETTTEPEATEPTETEATTEPEATEPTESETATEPEATEPTESETVTEPETTEPTETETAAESETTAPTETESEIDIQTYISQFWSLAASTEGGENYLADWKAAIEIFQKELGELPDDLAGQEDNTMEQYFLKTSIANDENINTEGLQEEYKAVCLRYVRALILLIDPEELDETRTDVYDQALEAYETAREAYKNLGMVWGLEIEESYILDACETILLIQAVDEEKEAAEIISAIEAARDAYEALPEEGKSLVWNSALLFELMKKYGVESGFTETEPETGDWDGGWGGDDFGGDFSDGYTAAELKEMIREKEKELKECELQIREAEIRVRQCERVVDGKVVKSTLNGTVLSIGSQDGSSDDEYFARVASTEGLYAKGSMNELSLAKIQVGDMISGVMSDNGESFTAEVKEISEYPDKSGGYYSYGSENTNASYYQFLALIEDSEGIEEGDAELQLSETMTDYTNSIYLEKYFVRTESDGSSYVMKRGEDGLLTKQYVTTGRSISNYAIEIVSGLSTSDRIAFPYGNDAVEGAQTTEVDQLDYE